MKRQTFLRFGLDWEKFPALENQFTPISQKLFIIKILCFAIRIPFEIAQKAKLFCKHPDRVTLRNTYKVGITRMSITTQKYYSLCNCNKQPIWGIFFAKKASCSFRSEKSNLPYFFCHSWLSDQDRITFRNKFVNTSHCNNMKIWIFVRIIEFLSNW